MSDNLKQFKNVLIEALIKHFSERDEMLSHRMVVDKASGQLVRTWLDETLGEMKGETKLISAEDLNGTVFAAFQSETEDKVYTFNYIDGDSSIMNIIVEQALAS